MKKQSTTLRDEDGLRQKQRVGALARAVNEFPIPLGCKVARDVAVPASGSAYIEHALGRPAIGYMVYNHRYSGGPVYRGTSTDERCILQLNNSSAADLTVDVVFW